MYPDETIHAHIVSVWREANKFMSIGGREGMLLLTDGHLCFIHKTESKKRWWTAIVTRQVVKLLRAKSVMIRHDGYGEEDLARDLENKKNVEIPFDCILEIGIAEKGWGSVLEIEYALAGKREKFRYTVAQDWVKYPVKEPTKFMKVDWEPLVAFIKERQKVVR